MEASSCFFDQILYKLAEYYYRSCTLEELTKLINPHSDVSITFCENIIAERENHAKILDALILLDYEGFIILNSFNDESFITIKGLIRINNKVLCN